MRDRLRRAFDRFIDAREMDDREVAEWMRAQEIDIAVDLKGYTADARTGILMHRPAPVQVNYLGYPGTLGLPYIDYIIADAFVIPCGDERWYSEKVVRLPDSYQVNDSRRAIDDHTPSRTELGLPERRLRVLLLQQQLQDPARGVRRLDATARERSGKRAVAAR